MASRPLAEVPDGIHIFVDTNILIYHLLDDDLDGASCRTFLQRVEVQLVTAWDRTPFPKKPWAERHSHLLHSQRAMRD